MKRIATIAIVLLLAYFNNPAYSQTPPRLPHLIERGIVDSVKSATLGEQRTIWVHLPNSYAAGNIQDYPVLYVLDGGVHLNALATILDYQSPAYMPEMIIVGISNRENRTRDLTTSKVESRRGRQVEESGGAEKFTTFIEKELIPHINKKYRTTSYKTLIGHSYAGLFTINMFLKHSELFNNYISIDPSMDWDNQHLLKHTKIEFHKKKYKGKSLYVTIANNIPRFSDELDVNSVVNDTTEFSLSIRSQLEFVKFIESNAGDLNFSWKYYEKEIHGTVPLVSMFDALRSIFKWYEIKSPSKFNRPDTPLAELMTLIRNRTETLTEHFGYPSYAFDEELLNMLGYMYMDMAQLEKSEAFFKLNIEYYPTSPNAYDSMADYYLSQKNTAMAIQMVTKALEISGDDIYKKRLEKLKSEDKE